MGRSALVGNVTAMLEDAGFIVSDRCAVRPKSFDVAARRGEEILLVKILSNIDAFDARTGAEMRRLGQYLGSTPLVIGLRTRDQELDPGVAYFRHGVPVFSPDTALDLFVEGVPPLIYAAPGGLYVNIDSDVLADAREQRGWSLGRLAQELGVSRRTVSKYEDGMDASVEVAAQLKQLFDAPLTSPVELFEEESVRESEAPPDAPDPSPEDEHVVAVLTRVGYDVHPTDRAPFETVSDDGEAEQVLTGHSEFTKTAEKRARIMSSVGRVTRTRPVYIVDTPPASPSAGRHSSNTTRCPNSRNETTFATSSPNGSVRTPPNLRRRRCPVLPLSRRDIDHARDEPTPDFGPGDGGRGFVSRLRRPVGGQPGHGPPGC